jgi:hypothetical protein
MTNKTLIHTGMAALLIFSAGCSSPHSERAAKMARTGQKANFQSDAEWFAQCTQHAAVWRGPSRTEKEWAIRDAGGHEREFPGHRATIEH